MNAVVQLQPASAFPAPVAASFTMSDMERVALAIAKGGLFGSNDPNAVLTLCMLAQAEGQHPAVVFRDYHIINGKPAKKAEAMHRDFLAAGGKIEWHRCDDECADATFSHPQGGSMRITWDNARVSQAQLTGNAMHKKYPRQMKRSRVISEGVRSVFPMATSGLYETGEVQDIVSDTAPAAPQPQRARDMEMGASTESGRAKAETWVAEQIEAVLAAVDHDALDAVIHAGNRAVAKLARDHADLHAQVQQAYEARASALDGYGDTDHPGTAKANALVTQADAATDRDAITAIDAEFGKHAAAMSGDDVERVVSAIERAKGRLS